MTFLVRVAVSWFAWFAAFLGRVVRRLLGSRRSALYRNAGWHFAPPGSSRFLSVRASRQL